MKHAVPTALAVLDPTAERTHREVRDRLRTSSVILLSLGLSCTPLAPGVERLPFDAGPISDAGLQPDSGGECIPTGPEHCANQIDDDCDDRTDWDDTDCVPPTGFTFGEPELLDLRGGTGGNTINDDLCADGTVAMGIEGDTRAEPPNVNAWISRLGVACGTPQITQLEDDRFEVTVDYLETLPIRGMVWDDATPYVRRCPENEVLVAFDGRSGSWIDQLQLSCVSLEAVPGSDGRPVVATATITQLPSVGGEGGSEFEVSACPMGSVAAGFTMNYTSYIDGLAMWCRPITLSYP